MLAAVHAMADADAVGSAGGGEADGAAEAGGGKNRHGLAKGNLDGNSMKAESLTHEIQPLRYNKCTVSVIKTRFTVRLRRIVKANWLYLKIATVYRGQKWRDTATSCFIVALEELNSSAKKR